jgi:HlyD family secretion protein
VIDSLKSSLIFNQRLGLAVLLTLPTASIAVSAVTPIAGAVVSQGVVAIENHSTKVQHAEGGTAAEIDITDGKHVNAGDVLIRLDDAELKTNLAMVENDIVELQCRRARLLAERDGSRELPAELAPGGSNLEATAIWNAQSRLLKVRFDVRDGKKQQLTERIAQLEAAITGLQSKIASKEAQGDLLLRELRSLDDLAKQKLVPSSKMFALQRESQDSTGEIGEIASEIARSKEQIGEVRLELLEVDQSFLSDALAELRDVEQKLAEAQQKSFEIKQRLEHTIITAASAGIVNKLTVTNVKSVVKPGEVIAEIVPQDSPLILEARVEPSSIDRIVLGQPVVVRFPAFDRRDTPELAGTTSLISPDVKQDAPGTPPYYLVQVTMPTGEFARLGTRKILPGMPCELMFQTGERTVLNFLLKPFQDQITRAMREK